MAVVLGKYLSAVFMFAIMMAGTLPFMLFLSYVGNPDWLVIGSAYLGIMLLAGSFISFGMFASSLTENQIISAVISFGGLFTFWIVEWATTFTEGTVNKVIGYVSIMTHFDNLSKGLIDSRDVIYYLLFIVFFLFCTLRYLDSKKWRA